MTVNAYQPIPAYHLNDNTDRFCGLRTNPYHQLHSACPQECLDVFGEDLDFEDCRKPRDLKFNLGRYCHANGQSPSLSCTSLKHLFEEQDSFQRSDVKVMHCNGLKQLSNELVTFPSSLKQFIVRNIRKEFIGRRGFGEQCCSDFSVGLMFFAKNRHEVMFYIIVDEIFQSEFGVWKCLTVSFSADMALQTEFATGVKCQGKPGFICIYGIDFSICLMFYMFYKTFVCYFVCCVVLCYAMLFCTNLYKRIVQSTCAIFFAESCTWRKVPLEFFYRIKVPSEFYSRVMISSELVSGAYRTVGRRKEGEQKSGKQKKNGSKYGGKRDGGRSRRTSQGNGSSGMEGSGEGSGNGDDSSDDDDDDDDDGDDEDQDDEDDEEEGDDEEEMDTDNVSAMAEDEAEDTTNGGGEEVRCCS